MDLNLLQNGDNGPGLGTENDVAELIKALEAGYQQTNQTGGSALRVESLENTLKVITYQMQHFKIWKDIFKAKAFSTVEEYNELSSYGSDAGGFISEGELPQEETASYTRKASLVKYLGNTRKITHPMTLVKAAHGDVKQQENEAGILWILRQAEQALITGNSSLAFNGESQQFSGFDALIDSAHFVDAKGYRLSNDWLEEAVQEVVDEYAIPNKVYLGTQAMRNYVAELYPRERFNHPSPQDGKVGFAVKTFSSQGGELEFTSNVFIRPTPTVPTAATSTNAPTAPASIAAGALAGTDGEFDKAADGSDEAGDFLYWVTAVNKYGESAAVQIGAAVTITAGDYLKHVPLTITNAASVTVVPEFFNIYRSVKDGSIGYKIGSVAAASQANGGTTTFNDINRVLPGTSTAYVGEMDKRIMVFKQLAPLMTMDLAVISPAYRWMILLYGVPQLFAPKKFIRIINLGSTANP